MPDQDIATSRWRRYLAPRQMARIFREALAWAWFAVAGGGGFGLILTEGPLPLTHGWYAMLSGIALCPATAWLLKRYAGADVSFLPRFIVAALLIAAGRLALVIGPWPVGPH